MSENNINTVNVLSVDEERLKYRAIIHCSAVGARKGEFNILLPPPTAFANSNHYNQCVIKIDSFTATPFPGMIVKLQPGTPTALLICQNLEE